MLHPVRHYSLFRYRKSAGSPCRWTSSSVFPKTLTRIMVFLCSLTGSARWYILLQCLSRSRNRAVLVSLSTRYFDSTGYPVNSYPTVTLGSRQSFGNPRSDLSEHGLRCQHLTILKQMVRPNAQTASSKKFFEDTSTRLRVGANFCRWSNSPSTTRCMHQLRIHRFS